MFSRCRAAAVCGLAAGVLAVAGCRAPLDSPHASPAALGRAVLEAVAAGDERALRALALDEQEFREQVWPELPASRPERNLPVDYVWNDLRAKSEGGLRRMLAAHGGRRYELAQLTFTGRVEQYRSFLVHRDSIVRLSGPEGGTTARLFGSVIEKGGRFKVFSYAVDD